MKNCKKLDKNVNRVIDSIFYALLDQNDILYVNTFHVLDGAQRHLKNYWMVYWFLLGKIFAIAMFVTGIHFVVAHFNKVLPFGIVSENMGLWFIWAYTGWFIGSYMAVYGIIKLFECTIDKWLETL